MDDKKPVVVGCERPDGTKVIAEFDSSVTDYFKQRIKETAKPKPCPKCGGEMTKEDFPDHNEAHYECPRCGYQKVMLYGDRDGRR